MQCLHASLKRGESRNSEDYQKSNMMVNSMRLLDYDKVYLEFTVYFSANTKDCIEISNYCHIFRVHTCNGSVRLWEHI